MKVGYGEDMCGQATIKFEIVAETTDGRYVVRALNGTMGLIIRKDIQDIHEEEA